MRSAVAAAVMAAGSFGAASGQEPPPDIRSLPFSFTLTKVPNSNFGEPSIALSSKEHVFMCGPTGLPGGRNAFIRSPDWKTFKRIDINDPGGGGDCDVKVGRDDAVYTANLQLWASAIRKSVDDGVTFTYQTTEDPVLQDRQWLAPDPVDASILYFGYHEPALGPVIMAKSLDGGRTFPIHTVVSTEPTLAPDSAGKTFPGPVRVDPTNHLRVYMPWVISSVQECARAPANCPFRPTHTVVVGRSDDGGLTWKNSVAMTAPPGSVLGNLIPWLAVDLGGNVHVVAGGRIPDASGVQTNGMYLASSTDRGATWSAPVKVNAGAGAVVFPTIAAGAAGVVDLAWLESTGPDPNTSAVWTLHFAQGRDAHAPARRFTEVVGPVVRNGAVCTLGLLCSGNRELLDFIEVVVDSFGYAHVVTASTQGSRHVEYWRQDAGPSAFSEPCPVDPGPDCVTVRPGPRP